MKTFFSAIALIILLAVVGVVYLYVVHPRNNPLGVACTQEAKLCPDGSFVGRTGPDCAFAPCPGEAGGTASDYKNATYTIDGQPVTLTNGVSSAPTAPGSAVMVTTTYFGNEATGDLNGDGMPDVAFLLTQNSGGSGTFYYTVVALKTASGYQGTNAVLLGDRIAPQTTQIQNGEVIVNYADRAPGEPMTAQPSVGVSKYLKISGGELIEAGS